MLRNIAYIGFGELGKQFDLFISRNSDDETVFFDDNLYAAGVEGAKPFSFFENKEFENFDFYIALGYRHLTTKHKIICQNTNLNFPKFIHGSSYVSPNARVGDAVFVYPMSNIDKGVDIGKGTLINNSVVISHDSVIGEACYLSPGVVVSGQVNIGDCTFVGSGTVISNGLKIGKNVTVGIGTVVTKDIPDNSIVIGNPMRFLPSKLDIV
jgi:sugar O-acyltransferase (sialic acid O-acetyltransferase NeuD family)